MLCKYPSACTVRTARQSICGIYNRSYVEYLTVNEDTTLSPQMILMGYRPTSPIDMLRELVEDDEHHILTAEERLEHYLQQRDDDRRDHCDRLRVDRERQETASKNKTQKQDWL